MSFFPPMRPKEEFWAGAAKLRDEALDTEAAPKPHSVAQLIQHDAGNIDHVRRTESCVVCRCGRRSRMHYTVLDAAIDHLSHVDPAWADLPAISLDRATMQPLPCEKGDRLATVMDEIAAVRRAVKEPFGAQPIAQREALRERKAHIRKTSREVQG